MSSTKIWRKTWMVEQFFGLSPLFYLLYLSGVDTDCSVFSFVVRSAFHVALTCCLGCIAWIWRDCYDLLRSSFCHCFRGRIYASYSMHRVSGVKRSFVFQKSAQNSPVKAPGSSAGTAEDAEAAQLDLPTPVVGQRSLRCSLSNSANLQCSPRAIAP